MKVTWTRIFGVIIFSHFLVRNKKVTQLMDALFETIMCSYVLVPLIMLITSQKGCKSTFEWKRGGANS